MTKEASTSEEARLRDAELGLERSPSRLAILLAWARRCWVPLVLIAAALAMCGTVTALHPQSFSPLDEWVYYDYVTKIPTQGIVHEGEAIGRPGLEAMSCFGDTFGPRGLPCVGPNGAYDDPSAYPQAGKTTADIYTPLYFDITWGLAKAIQFLTGASLLVAARLTGFFWLAGGLVAFYALAKEFKVNKLVILGLGLITIGLPSSILAFTYITTDAPSLLFGALILLFGIRFIRGRLPGWWLFALSSFAVLFKVTNIFAVGLVALTMIIYVAMKWRRRRGLGTDRPPLGRILLVAGCTTVAAVVVECIWLAIRAAIKVGDPPNQGNAVPLSLKSVITQLTTFLGVPSPSTIDGLLTVPYALMAIAGIVGFFAMTRGTGMKRAFSVATLASGTLFAPLLAFALSVALGSVFPVAPRYAQSLMPAFLIAIATMIRNTTARILLILYGAAIVAIAIAREIHH